jgi:hypothetical protein
VSRPSGAGELAIVLHSHMPYVEGFGTWPFGEEWPTGGCAPPAIAPRSTQRSRHRTLDPRLRDLAPDVTPAALLEP